MNTFIIILSSLIAVGAIVGAFMSRPWAAAAAYVALGIAGGTESSALSVGTLIFWLAATVIVTIIVMTIPRAVARATAGVPYLTGATLVGMFLGLCIGHAAIIPGAVTGALLGAVAYCRTPSGRALGFPGKKAMNYLCAKAFPIIITICMTGELIAAFTLPQ